MSTNTMYRYYLLTLHTLKTHSHSGWVWLPLKPLPTAPPIRSGDVTVEEQVVVETVGWVEVALSKRGYLSWRHLARAGEAAVELGRGEGVRV